MKKTGKGKRIAALCAVVLLVGLYVFSLISAIFAKPYANGLFLTSVFATFAVPIFVYGIMLIKRAFGGGRDKNAMTLNQVRKMKNQMKDEPSDPEDD